MLQEANAAFRAINMALAQADSRMQAAKPALRSSDPGSGGGDGQAGPMRLLQEALAAEGQCLSDAVREVCDIVLPGPVQGGGADQAEVRLSHGSQSPPVSPAPPCAGCCAPVLLICLLASALPCS